MRVSKELLKPENVGMRVARKKNGWLVVAKEKTCEACGSRVCDDEIIGVSIGNGNYILTGGGIYEL